MFPRCSLALPRQAMNIWRLVCDVVNIIFSDLAASTRIGTGKLWLANLRMLGMAPTRHRFSCSVLLSSINCPLGVSA